MDLQKLTRKNTAIAFGVNVRTIGRWHDLGMPRNNDGTYNLPFCIQWKIDQIQEDIIPERSETEESQHWLTEYRKERAKLARLEREQLEGELIPAEDVRRDAAFAGRMVKEKVSAWPGRVAPLVAVESDVFKVDQILRRECNQLLEEISEAVKP